MPDNLELIVALIVFLFGAAIITYLFITSAPTPAQYPESISTKILESGGWNLRYHQSGQGPDLLLLHGIGANLFCWRKLIPLLSSHYRVTALDLPGFGGSSKPAGAHYGLDDQAERIAKALSDLNIECTAVIGSSMGANIALWLALKYPHHINALALIAPATNPKLVPVSIKSWIWASLPISLMLNRLAVKWAHGRTVSNTVFVDTESVEETYRTYGRQAAAVRSFMLATEAIRDARLLPGLAHLRQKVLILWGSKDKLVNRSVIDNLAKALPKAESEVHLGGGHHLQEEEPEWLAEKIQAFLRVQPDGNPHD